MKRWFALLAVLLVASLLMPKPPPLAALDKSGAIAANGDCVTLSSNDTGNGSFQITGTFTGTISFTASNDAVNWVAINASTPTSSAVVTSATTTGLWLYSGTFKTVRACATAWTSGTATVIVLATFARSAPSGGVVGSFLGLTYDGTNILTLKNGSNAERFRIYGNSTAYGELWMDASGTGDFHIGSSLAGIGFYPSGSTTRNMVIDLNTVIWPTGPNVTGLWTAIQTATVAGYGAGLSTEPTQTYTSGVGGSVMLGGEFTPASGSGSWDGVSVLTSINGVSSGVATAFKIASKTNTLTGGTVKALSVGTTTNNTITGYTENVSINMAGVIQSVDDIKAGAGSAFQFTGQTRLTSGGADGNLLVTNASSNGFGRLIFSTNNTSGVALNKNTTTLETKLGDGSAYTDHAALSFQSTGSTFANLGTPPAGTMKFCTDCDPPTLIDSTCTHAGAQTGSLAIRQNGAWKCVS